MNIFGAFSHNQQEVSSLSQEGLNKNDELNLWALSKNKILMGLILFQPHSGKLALFPWEVISGFCGLGLIG